MRRRRFPRRPLRRRPVMRQPHRRPPIPPKLMKAHRLFDEGEFQKAAKLYNELAKKATERGIPQAPNLYLRAAAALLKAGDPEEAVEIVKTGLGILVARQKWLQLKKAGSLTVERLMNEGQDDLAAEIQAWLEEQIPDHVKNSDAWQMTAVAARSGSVKLPTTCGQCGGPVNLKEIEWFDTNNPICSYCGAVLETNS